MSKNFREDILNEKIESVVEWLLSSGIQNPRGTKDKNGFDVSRSFNAWFDLEEKRCIFAYSEISGYALTALLYLYREGTNDRYLKKAKLVADWLLTIQNSNGSFPTAFYLLETINKKPDVFHTFDTGVILNGLVNVYREARETKYLLAAKKAADFISNFQRRDGLLPAMVDRSGKIKDNLETWSSQPGGYHAKLAIGLLNIYDITKKTKYLKTAKNLCDYALSLQRPDGQLFTYKGVSGTNFHPHLYTAEGLWAAGIYLGKEEYLTAAKRAVKWVLSCERGGIVPRHKFGNKLNYNERADILAQTLRLSMLVGIRGDQNSRILGQILNRQYFGRQKRQRGGFLFGKLSSGKIVPHVNCWVSLFALQALKLSQNPTLKSCFDLI